MAGRIARSPLVVPVTVVLALSCVAAVVAWNAPANWLALYLARSTGGVVLLADAQGTIWSGSAVLALGSPVASDDVGATDRADSARLALPGRITWTLEIDRALAPVLHLTHDGVLLQPLSARYRDGLLTLEPGAAVLPASMLRLVGAPLNTLLPEGRCELRWTDLRFGAAAPVGDGTLQVTAFSLALSPVRPLGDYRVSWSSGERGLTWQLVTEHGPLDAQGSGSLAGRRTQARVVLRAARDTPPAVAAQLNPLLDLIGRHGADEAVIETGGRS